MKKMTLILVLVIMLFSSCDRGSTDNGSFIDLPSSSKDSLTSSSKDSLTSSSASISDPLTSKQIFSKSKVEFGDVKDELIGGYSYRHSLYSYNYLFFENGDYYIIGDGKIYTPDNSFAEYYCVSGETDVEIQITFSREDGETFQISGTKFELGYPNDPFVCAYKTSEEFSVDVSRKKVNSNVFYKMEDFNNIDIGASNYWDIFEVEKNVNEKQNEEMPNTEIGSLVYVSPIGDITEFPMADGKYIRVTYDEGLIVKSIEVVDELCEVYY